MALNIYQRAGHALRWFLLHRLPTCQTTVALLSESCERPLTMRERVQVKLHLWVCLWCVWYLEQIRHIRDRLRAQAAQAMDDESSDLALTAEARERIKRALNHSTR